jgi:hypothetical protein
MEIAPLRPFDRIVAGYVTLAFALALGESVVLHEWVLVLITALFSAAGAALLLHDHRRWRSRRRGATNTVIETP